VLRERRIGHYVGLVVRIPLLLGLGVFLVGFLAAWVGWGVLDADTGCLDAYPRLPEGSAVRPEPAVWPPGGQCEYELPDGTHATRSMGVPWFEWTVAAVLGAITVLVALPVRAALRGRGTRA
jgi:hypothetical protein